MAKMCDNCACYEVCIYANPNRTKDCTLWQPEMKWIPVSERLPEELPKNNPAWSEMVRPSVDVLVKIKGLKQLYTAWYSYSHKEWTDVREEHSFTGVTHWMPLPELPKEV